MKQCRISSGTMRDVLWLKNPKEGKKVTLKDSDDPKREWTIDIIYEPDFPKEKFDRYRRAKFWSLK